MAFPSVIARRKCRPDQIRAFCVSVSNAFVESKALVVPVTDEAMFMSIDRCPNRYPKTSVAAPVMHACPLAHSG